MDSHLFDKNNNNELLLGNLDIVVPPAQATKSFQAPDTISSTPDPKYNNQAPKLPTYTTLQPNNMSFSSCKSQLSSSCNKQLPGVSKALWQAWVNGGLSIVVSIHCSKGYNSKDKKTIKVSGFFDNTFEAFIKSTLTAPATLTMGFPIILENPLKTKNAH
ncbi:uncharacterized protein MELLADRAFT_61306 [Melampsora larici-populina 98AG31]|uniref:Uncharacterized protein n=1 Tax=Melampsora larici-populina (strain 98AG31 / pathotype 3-4-7) TaxID=747676 RepID=F4RED6_MELLP|nr:uncharacterized protein MELLADRAFT_61306 [Melampsora larici-populina 98AG31]EGG09291.1 hypothetical protein MELLADRAFT_61306 [Melampsora larici-populina 98AG31]